MIGTEREIDRVLRSCYCSAYSSGHKISPRQACASKVEGVNIFRYTKTMKTEGNYSNGQAVKEQKGDILTYYHLNGDIKAQGKCVDGLFQGKWVFNKKAGFLWGIGHFKDHEKHGKWTRFKADGSIEKEQTFQGGKLVK